MSFSREHPRTFPNHPTSTLTNTRKRDNAALVDATTSTINNASKKRKVDRSQKDNQASTIRHDHSGASTWPIQAEFGDMIEHCTQISATREVQVYDVRYYPRDSAHVRPKRPLPSIAAKPRADNPARHRPSHASTSSTASSSTTLGRTTAPPPRAPVSQNSSSLPKTTNHRATTAKQTAKPSKSAKQPRGRRRPQPSKAKGPRPPAKRAPLPAVVTPGSSATSSAAASPTTPTEKPKEPVQEMSVEEYNALWQRITPGCRPPLTRAQVRALPKIPKKKKSESVAA